MRYVRIGTLVAVVAGCAQPAAVSTTPAPSRELTSIERARHAVSRLTFGARPGEVERVAAMGVDRWIAMQLDPSTIPDDAVTRLTGALETQRKSIVELIADHPLPQELQIRLQGRPSGSTPSAADTAMYRQAIQSTGRLSNQVAVVKTMRAVASERELAEVMTDFWENHFSVFAGKTPTPFALVEYDRDVIRPHVLGHFKDLLTAVARSTEMLFYLDNFQSAVDSTHANVQEQRIEARRAASGDPTVMSVATLPHRRPRGVNENYARELMELHTLGVDGGYTQRDVINVARALTGWTIDAPQLGGGFVFRPELHDASPKVVLGHTLAAGRGIEDGEEVLAILARAPATAHYISTKLARHFVADDPPRALVDRCANVFQKTDGDIRETIRCIVTSPEFFSRAAYRAKVKTPFELVVSGLRALGAEPDTTPRAAQMVAQLGQPVFGRQTPDGWPDRGSEWMNAGALLRRINFGLTLANGQAPGARLQSWPPAARLRNLPAVEQVQGVIDELLGGDVSAETRAALAGGNGLAGIVGVALGAPEFQRR